MGVGWALGGRWAAGLSGSVFGVCGARWRAFGGALAGGPLAGLGALCGALRGVSGCLERLGVWAFGRLGVSGGGRIAIAGRGASCRQVGARPCPRRGVGVSRPPRS